MSTKETNYDRFIGTYTYKSLLGQYDLDEQGIWQIFGEDPNCDFGGTHYQPDLGFAEGKLEDVIAYAVELPDFWTWGSGGDIRKISKIAKVDSQIAERRRKLNAMRAEYVEMIKKIDLELEMM